jgi:PIN domain nuclease of toxin-antitoxin system
LIALDASALLAFLFGESGAESVAGELSSACISAVNLSEVLARFARDGHDTAVVTQRLRSTPLEIVSFGWAEAAITASLAAPTRAAGLSLGDRACLALALARDVPAMTADRAWSKIDVGVNIRLIR